MSSKTEKRRNRIVEDLRHPCFTSNDVKLMRRAADCIQTLRSENKILKKKIEELQTDLWNLT